MGSLYLQHYGIKGIKWGVRRHNRREEKIARAEAKGNTRKVARLKAQRARVQSYRDTDRTGADVGRAVLSYMARNVAINVSTLAAGSVAGQRGRQFVNMAARTASLANTVKLGTDIANIVEAKTTQRVKSKK